MFLSRSLLVFIFFLIFSTLHAQKEGRGVGIIRSKQIYLDKETAYPNSFGSKFQYCLDINAIAYLNRLTNSIKYFDYNTGQKLELETPLAIYGPNAMGKEPNNFLYHNKDSIFITSAGSNFTLFLVDRKGSIRSKFSYASDQYDGIPFPKVSKVKKSLHYEKPFVFISVQAASIQKGNGVSPIIKLNLSDNSFKYLREPRAYQGFDVELLPNNNQEEFYEPDLAYDYKRERLLVTFPMEDPIYQIKGEKVTKILAFNNEKGQFKRLSRTRDRYARRDLDYLDVTVNSARYTSLLYHNEKDVFYRIAKVSGDRTQLSRALNGERVKRPFLYSVAIFNADFDLLSESIIKGGDAYFERGLFMSPDGLWALRVNDQGEDIMEFALIGLEK